jgi:O-antigen/teichoic acid export membrane protein
MNQSESRLTFFRQSGWMALAALLGGVLNMATTFVAQRMPDGQYNIFDTALSALGILTIPALGMQAAFAAQAAGADSDLRRRELAATVRGAFLLLLMLWLAMVGWWLARADAIMTAYKLSNPEMLWALLFIVLVNLLSPVPTGVLQGRQDFFWFGWSMLLNGAFRFGVIWIVVHHLGQGALGGLAGVLAGCGAVLALVAWRSWDAIIARGARGNWRAWAKRLLPVTLGLGALSFIMQFDALAVRENLQLQPNAADGFSAVRKIAQALVFVVGALTSVMFPKISRSFQQSEPSEVLKLTLILTAIVAAGGATLATLVPGLPLRLLSPERLADSKYLVAPYCWALVPLALSNVLVWNLLAREYFRAVPWMVAIALACWMTLLRYGQSPLKIIGIVGLFNSLLCVTCAIFAWRDLARPRGNPAPTL